ncbi:hypothetical protein LJC45_04835 [Alistipes sp. OttesenSCG-928-B03]|nr:hypothetical protein [Alistipes sp. OttesenSCG-928-B03]
MKKKRITEKDYVKANRKASREEEIAQHGHTVSHGRVHESKKTYNRKREKAGLKSLLSHFRKRHKV